MLLLSETLGVFSQFKSSHDSSEKLIRLTLLRRNQSSLDQDLRIKEMGVVIVAVAD